MNPYMYYKPGIPQRMIYIKLDGKVEAHSTNYCNEYVCANAIGNTFTRTGPNGECNEIHVIIKGNHYAYQYERFTKNGVQINYSDLPKEFKDKFEICI